MGWLILAVIIGIVVAALGLRWLASYLMTSNHWEGG